MGSDRGDDRAPDRPIFCGNFEYDASEREIVRLFEKYGEVERIDMKTGFAFLYMRDTRDGDDAIRGLDRKEWGYKRRPLKVEWAKRAEGKNKDQQPSNTLFVVNFDVRRTLPRDLEEYYGRYGRLTRVDIKRNYGFVEFQDLEDAITAQRKTHQASFNGRTLTVEFCTRSDKGGGESRGARERERSPVPSRRRSPSPATYGRSSRRHSRSPPPSRRRSPSPGTYGKRRSVSPSRRSPDRSPDRRRASPARRARSPRSRSRSPVRPADSRSRSPSRDRSPMRD